MVKEGGGIMRDNESKHERERAIKILSDTKRIMREIFDN
jgi:hypothetical protein